MSDLEPSTNEQLTRLLRTHKQFFGPAPSGRILEFGCGRGEFLRAAVDAGLDCHGVENDRGRRDSFMADVAAVSPEYDERFHLYDGSILPFPAESFDLVYSWFVLEHVPDVMQSVREMVRVLKPGGAIILFSQEAANGFDGHCDIPWPPYLPRQFYRPYLEEFDFDEAQIEYMESSTYFISAKQVVAGLEAFGCETVYESRPTPSRVLRPFDHGVRISCEGEARELARAVRAHIAGNEWQRPKEHMLVAARRTPVRFGALARVLLQLKAQALSMRKAIWRRLNRSASRSAAKPSIERSGF